jgi:nucleotidyltransferase substrate binding protein (TIGR01987 family)
MKKERLLERLEDYNRASQRLAEAVNLDPNLDIIIDGVIQRFEFTFELSWKLMKVFLEYTGITEIRSPRTTIREAFAYGLIEDGDQWIDMMEDRNKTSHIYDEVEAKQIYQKIKHNHNELLLKLAVKMEQEINIIT